MMPLTLTYLTLTLTRETLKLHQNMVTPMWVLKYFFPEAVP